MNKLNQMNEDIVNADIIQKFSHMTDNVQEIEPHACKIPSLYKTIGFRP